MKRYIFLAAAAALCLWQCTTAEVQPLQYAAPEAEFPTDVPDSISISVGDTCTFSVNFTSGEKLTKEWTVNGLLESSTDKLTYIFNDPGTFTVSFKAYNGSGSVQKSYTVTVGDKLEMCLSIGDSTAVSRPEESYLQLYAIVKHGEEVEHSWSVDGVKKSDKAYFNTFFIGKNPAEGSLSYKVEYKGTNPTGDVYTKAFTVNVKDRPLTVKFSDDSKNIFGRLYPELTLSVVEILYGGTGVKHNWYVGDKLVSETESLKYMFPVEGDYTIKYVGTNAAGDKVERTWAAEIAPEALISDFEDGTYDKYFAMAYDSKDTKKQESIKIYNNPLPGGINDSAKCLRFYINTNTGFTYGGFNLLTDNLPFSIKDFDGVRFYAYMKNTNNADITAVYPAVMYGSSTTSGTKLGDNELKGANNKEWRCLEYDIDLSSDGILTILPIQKLNTAKTAPAKASNYRYTAVFLDDIILYKKTSDSSTK